VEKIEEKEIEEENFVRNERKNENQDLSWERFWKQN
jgi:hypothetical protein